jgi:N-acetylmuramoyl-L-alanine amidase
MITKYSSPNFEDRPDSIKPSYIILHYTGMKSAKEALDRLCDSASKVSAHYLIDEGGDVYQLVDESKRAWHAGESYWGGEEDINSHSIGIELVNPGHEFGYKEFTGKQIEALTALCQDIKARHGIEDINILGHSDVAPGRKIDPGELFKWKEFADKGVGVWPCPVKEDFERASNLMYNAKRLRQAFEAYGYNPKIDLKTLITSFQRHFQPDVFTTPEKVGQANIELGARLQALVRLKSKSV